MFQKMLQGGSGSGGDTIETLTFTSQKPGGYTPIIIQLTPAIVTTPKAVKFAMGVGGNLFTNMDENGEILEYVRSSATSNTYSYTFSDNKITIPSFDWSGGTLGVAGMAVLYG